LSELPFRCSASSLARDEPLAGTASTFRRYLLAEYPGPWGVDALRDSRLPTDIGVALRRQCKRLRIRPALIRRHGRSAATPRIRIFAAYTGPERSWTETVDLDGPEGLLRLDLEALGEGRSLGLEPWDAPLFLTCTHGRHDACCAERGRPVARALFASHPDEAWEVSHIGGDRFAGNVLVLPHGLYYGRLDPESAARVAVYHHEGRIDLAHFRGRTCYSWPTQAAEIFLRRELALDGIAAVELVDATADGDLHTCRLRTAGGGLWTVVVRQGTAPPHRLTCSALRDSSSPTHTLLSIEPAPA
jgi:hypothetical protein